MSECIFWLPYQEKGVLLISNGRNLLNLLNILPHSGDIPHNKESSGPINQSVEKPRSKPTLFAGLV